MKRNMRTGQIELNFEAQAGRRLPRPGESRRHRAQWWFAQMRLVVDRAIDWRAAPRARPQQGYFVLTAHPVTMPMR